MTQNNWKLKHLLDIFRSGNANPSKLASINACYELGLISQEEQKALRHQTITQMQERSKNAK